MHQLSHIAHDMPYSVSRSYGQGRIAGNSNVVFRYYCQVAQILIRIVLHVVRMSFGAIVYLAFGYGLRFTVIIKVAVPLIM